MPELDYDVAVVGAGPAGSTTALRLARAGFSVALLDAQRFPRFKACGEFMSPACVPLLRELGVGERLTGLGAREVRGMLLHAHERQANGRFVDVGRTRRPHDAGWSVRREVFDETLVRSAQEHGVHVLEGQRVIAITRGAGGEVLGVVARDRAGERHAIRARWTIGADGVRSHTAEELGVRREVDWLRKIALVTRYAGVPWGDQAEVHLFDGGYFAASPVDGGLVSLNLVLDRARFLQEGLPRDAALERWLERVPALGRRMAAGTRVDPVRGTGPLAMTTRAQTFDGAALVGDACGYVDPITGEGIFFALKGAEMLAQHLSAALHAGRRDRAALDGYLEGRRREIEPRVRLSLLLQRGLRRPAFVRSAFALLEARPRLADLVVSAAGDYVPPRVLARPWVWLGALRAGRGAA